MSRSKIIPFLKKLKSNNNKEWFDNNRPEYEIARASLLELIAEITGKFGKIDPTIEGIDPKKSIFRINRDVRFSKNKDPYKTNMGAYLIEGGKKSPKAGYYLHIEPGGCFLAGGIWMPESETLKKIRQEIDYNGQALEKITKAASFKTFFGDLSEEDKLVRVPKDFEQDHKYAERLKLKSFIVSHHFNDKELSDPKFADYSTRVFKALMPLNSFLNSSLD